jgi:hypothetical protein
VAWLVAVAPNIDVVYWLEFAPIFMVGLLAKGSLTGGFIEENIGLVAPEIPIF